MPVYLKQGDQVETEWQAGIDLSDADELLFLAARQKGAPPAISKTATLDPNDPTIVVVLITSAESADIGRYWVEVQTTWPNGEIITLPDRGYAQLIIKADLN